MADLWYYTSQGQRMEPVTGAELKQLAASGLLKRTDLVWREGMPDWVRAETASGIFAGDAGPGEARTPWASAVVREAKFIPEALPLAGPADEPDEPRPRRRSRPDYDDDDVERRPRRRRRRHQGMGAGAKIALGVGGGLVVLVLVILGVWWIASSSDKGVAGPLNTYSVTLAQQRADTRFFHFRAGSRIEFTVRSDHNSDVDILVYDRNNNLVTGDESIGPNSFCMLVTPRDERYKIEIRNLGPGRNRSHVTIRDAGIGPAPPPMPPMHPK